MSFHMEFKVIFSTKLFFTFLTFYAFFTMHLSDMVSQNTVILERFLTMGSFAVFDMLVSFLTMGTFAVFDILVTFLTMGTFALFDMLVSFLTMGTFVVFDMLGPPINSINISLTMGTFLLITTIFMCWFFSLTVWNLFICV